MSRCLVVGCDESCKLKCSGAGPAGCEECANGYKMEDGSCEGMDNTHTRTHTRTHTHTYTHTHLDLEP